MRGRFLGVMAAGLLPLAAGAVTMETVAVGNLGNAPDPLNTNSVPGIGSVSYGYSIGKYEVFNSQYVEFLNAVADTDTYGLYNTSMASDARGGINRSGSSGSYTYSVKSGYENMPVVYVSFYDAVRFANWLENGQPTGAQGAGTTEAGSYTLFTSGSSTTNVSARASDALWVIPTENEWYKAAYHQPSGSGGPSDNYWLYPTQSDAIPNSRPPNGTDANSANFYRAVAPANGINDGFAKTLSTSYYSGTNYLTAVGSYSVADSYYGTFDQGGNVWEWDETIISGAYRGLRGGDWVDSEGNLRSSYRVDNTPSNEGNSIGFRVAAIPEPACVGAVLIAAVGLCVWKRRKRSL